jgi:hypothetical protein
MEEPLCIWPQVLNLYLSFLFCHSPHKCADQKQEEMIQFLIKAGSRRLADRWGNVPQ